MYDVTKYTKTCLEGDEMCVWVCEYLKVGGQVNTKVGEEGVYVCCVDVTGKLT